MALTVAGLAGEAAVARATEAALVAPEEVRVVKVAMAVTVV
jgi:hypothetical protein